MGKQQEIKNLIDKSIGTKGSLDIPSFWMNKILKDAIDLSQENIDELEELHTKELKKLKNNITDKADKMPIVGFNGILKPNIYATATIDGPWNADIYLEDIVDSSTYNEYIIEIKCTDTPSSAVFKNYDGTDAVIKWANEDAPIFEAGYTYIISIVNNFGVFAKFTNS